MHLPLIHGHVFSLCDVTKSRPWNFWSEGFVNIPYDVTTETRLPQELPPPRLQPVLSSGNGLACSGGGPVVDGVRGKWGATR